MRLVANTQELHRGLQRLGGVVGSAAQQPLYQHVKREGLALWTR